MNGVYVPAISRYKGYEVQPTFSWSSQGRAESWPGAMVLSADIEACRCRVRTMAGWGEARPGAGGEVRFGVSGEVGRRLTEDGLDWGGIGDPGQDGHFGSSTIRCSGRSWAVLTMPASPFRSGRGWTAAVHRTASCRHLAGRERPPPTCDRPSACGTRPLCDVAEDAALEEPVEVMGVVALDPGIDKSSRKGTHRRLVRQGVGDRRDLLRLAPGGTQRTTPPDSLRRAVRRPARQWPCPCAGSLRCAS